MKQRFGWVLVTGILMAACGAADDAGQAKSSGANVPGGITGGGSDAGAGGTSEPGGETSGPASGGSEYAGDGEDSAAWADAGVADEWGSGGSSGGGAPQQEAPLEGAEVDDNAAFAAFLDYYTRALDSFGADPAIHALPLNHRHLLTIRDAAGHTVPDAVVHILDGDREVALGRTRADGRFAFFPEGLEPEKYVVEADAAELSARETLLASDPLLTIALPAEVPAPEAHLDVAFVIDCTGSMSEEISRIKSTVSSIAARIEADPSHPVLRLGLVAYRDRGDAFVTQPFDFTSDVAAFQREVNGLAADGGDDFPESVNEALHDTMRRLSWSPDGAVRLAFLVADAPAHFYDDEQYTYADAMREASRVGVKFLPIASGGADPVAELQFRQLAVYTLGHFIFVTEGGGSDYAASGDGQQLRVEALDDLIVRLVTDELAAFTSRAVAPADPSAPPVGP